VRSNRLPLPYQQNGESRSVTLLRFCEAFPRTFPVCPVATKDGLVPSGSRGVL
jgi:hypothetical protein